MLLLGAGSSVPFGIPAMKEFVLNFESNLARDSSAVGRKNKRFLEQIKSALENSERLVGTKMPFDLESLMVVLQDLVVSEDRPMSTPTFALMLHLITEKRTEVGEYNITNTRQTFNDRAQTLLDSLRKFIFENCFKPIKIGREIQSFSFLDLLYTPLLALLGNGNFGESRTQWIFTTNWDLCLKQWLDYAMQDIPVQDGTKLDKHGYPVFSPGSWSKDTSHIARRIVPLHGNLGLRMKTKVIRGGSYEEIHKVTDPERYFEGNPSELAKAFMIFPLEAVGYEQSVRSPYLDMLTLLKERLKSESDVFIIGFSLRDPTIASIFEEVLRERAQDGDWEPIDRWKSEYTKEDTKRFGNIRLKVFLIDSSPETTIKYLKGHRYVNLANALIPIKATFPKIINRNKTDPEVLQKDIERLFKNLYVKLRKFGLKIDLGDIQRGIDHAGFDFRFPPNAP